MLFARQGDAKRALTKADQAIQAFLEQGDRRMEGAARLYRAFSLAVADDLSRGAQEVEAALEIAKSTPPLCAFALSLRARIHLQDGHPDKADEPAREAQTILENLGGIEEGEAYVRLTFAETLEATGDRDAARESIKTARVRILERAAMIQDPLWKDFFLEKVRENARTLELARQWRVV
jgi:hypothetical protein